MLLLTDRLNESLDCQRALAQVEVCAVAALHGVAADRQEQSLIVCDVALDNAVSVGLLRAALSRCRATPAVPVLFLMRDPSHLAGAQANELGASATCPDDAPRSQLVTTVRQLIGSDRAAEAPRGGTKAGAETAGASLASMFDAARQRRAIPVASLERGGDAVLAAVGRANIRGWLEIVWKHDDVTYQHCLLVAGLAAAFSCRLGLSTMSQRLVSQAALIHDIGKAQIPLTILNKASQLSDAELVLMRTHPAVGYDMLVTQNGFDQRLLDVVRHHHEYLDGSGYPDRLQRGQISDLVRLSTICDIYAALIERRPYKAPMSTEKALSILASMGRKLDEGLLQQFHGLVAA